MTAYGTDFRIFDACELLVKRSKETVDSRVWKCVEGLKKYSCTFQIALILLFHTCENNLVDIF